MADWKFYGRREQLADLERMLDRKRWFFAKVTGRRRIGKTTLIQQAMEELGGNQRVFYVQIPDSEPAGVLSAVNDALETVQVPADRHPRPNDLLQLAKLLEAMVEGGYILILDEFQYFNRKGYEEFCSFLQASVDRLAAKADQVGGGLIVLGSIHTEMVAFNETTESIRFGSCKRSAKKLMSDVNNFKQHVERFLKAMPKYEGWSKQLVGITPELDTEQRTFLNSHDILPQDLNDLTRGLTPS